MSFFARVFFAVLVALVIGGCSGDDGTQEGTGEDRSRKGGSEGASPNLDELPPLPTGYELRAEASGDLDKDGRPEKVLVVETDRTGEFGREREVMVFRWADGAWDLWHSAAGPVLPSEGGGTMGDPFALVEVDRGAIVIDHYGGSSLRWGHTHRYRYQDGDFHLIGATSGFGRPQAEWSELDYNLSTGRAVYTRQMFDDEGKEVTPPETTELTHRLDRLPTMDGFVPGENEMKIPGGEVVYY